MPSRTQRKRPIKLLIVDGHPCVATAFSVCFERKGHVSQAAYDAESALVMCREVMPEVVLVDLGLPGKGGIELLGELRAILPKLLVVFITASASPEFIHRAMTLGPDGFVQKRDQLEEIVHTVEEVAEGRKVFTREVMELAQRGSASTLRGGIGLSAAEEIVLRLMDIGKSTKEIALLRVTSESTVEKQRGAIFVKLGVHCATEAVNKARQLGLVT